MHERIRQKFIESGETQDKLAKKMGVSRQAVSKWIEGLSKPKGENLDKLAKNLNTTAEWLLYGKGQESTPILMIDYPLLSWDELSVYCETDYKESNLENSGLYFTHKTYTDYSFALRVQNDSMSRMTSPSFTEGANVLFEYQVEAKPNDFVLVRQDDEYIFRQLVKDGSRWLLKPLNPTYPIEAMADDSKVVAVAREMQTVI
ncbi:MAG: S24 family peptidase [Pseudomonadota bacterium]